MRVSWLLLGFPMPVFTAHPDAAFGLHQRNAALPLRARDADRVFHGAPFAREIRNGDSARRPLVDAPHAVFGEAHRKNRRIRGAGHDALGAIESWFCTQVTPCTDCVASCTRFLVSSESTWPFSVTTPALLSTSIFNVFRPTSLASAAFTFAVMAASPPARLASAVAASRRCPAVGLSDDDPVLDPDCAFAVVGFGGWLQPAITKIIETMAASAFMTVLLKEPGHALRRASRSAAGGFPARGSAARGARRAQARPARHG